MEKLIRKTVAVFMLAVIIAVLMPAGSIMANSSVEFGIDHVYASLGDTKDIDVLYQVMEVETAVMESITLDVKLAQPESGLIYRVFQYNASAKKRYEIGGSDSPTFLIDLEKLVKDIPVYLSVYRGSELLSTKLLVIRVNQGRAETMVVSEISSEYKDSLTVPMDELLPGMKFEMYPYIIPISCKAFTDGRVIIGMGINSSNVNFWKDARNGTLKQKTDKKELSDAFWGNKENRKAITGGDLGLVVNFSGWVQGNIYTNEPLTGELSIYIGSGFYVSGQYAILTFDVTVSVGVAGVLEFEFRYNEKNSKYDDFVVDAFSIQFTTALELYGGIGLSSIASVGLYGAGSITLKDQFYPDPVVRSLKLAGECGFKVKAFGKALFSFAIVSGSKEFVEDKDKVSSPGETALLNMSEMNNIGKGLFSSGYADIKVPADEPEGTGTWYTGMTPSGTLAGYETDPDFDHIIAEDIYPDNKLKTVKTQTGNFPQMNVVFLGSDPSRSNGNRSRLMNFYYREATSFLSDPVWVVDDSADDGTADYNPSVFHSELSDRTYLVWQNSMKEVESDASFREIAKDTDIFFTEFERDGAWKNVSRITDFADDDSSENFAVGARVWEDWDGEPLVTYYTNEASDPIGTDTSASHGIYIAQMADGEWVNERAFSVTGQVTDVACAYFHKSHTIAVCYNTDSAESPSGKNYYLELWQKTDGVWTKVFERKGADGRMIASARYIKSFKNQNILTWYENSRVYRMINEAWGVESMTAGDTPVPGPNYEIYGRYLDGGLAVIGTYSKDSSENAFAVYSPTGGATWARLDLTDIAENALVNGIGLAFTDKKEPIIFYSVQNYRLNEDLDMSHVKGDAEMLLAAPLRGKFEGLGSGLLLGQDDPRFIDTHTDLYVKARRANKRVKINDVTFTDVTGARKGSDTPAEVTIENNGMYDVDGVTVYLNGRVLTESDVFVRSGETKKFTISVPVPEDAPNAPIDYEVAVSCREDIIADTYTATLSPGELFVNYRQQLRYGNESLGYTVTAAGFAGRMTMIYLFDEDTGEMIYKYPTFVPAGQTIHSTTSQVGLYVQQGHTHIKAYVLNDEEQELVPADIDLAGFEELLKLPSTRAFVFKGLDTIYLQDVSGADKINNDPVTPPSEDTGYVPAVQPAGPAPEEPLPDEEKQDGSSETPDDTPVTPPAPPAPDVPGDGGNEDKPKPEPVLPERNNWIVPAVAGACGLGFILFFIILLIKRRKDDEEEEE